ncbi:MAG: aminotransferase class I/II-fold pyridoxal phosphate-dependent enzyme [Rikenellaceae bacterium]
MINGHGNNLYQFDIQSLEADFSSNVAFNNHSVKILDFLSGNMACLSNYPDPMATKLTAQIAAYHGVSAESVLVTNGSTEAFYLLAHHLASKAGAQATRTAITTPSFAEYEDSCALFNHAIEHVSLKDFREIDPSALDSIWLASPNNPDGYRISLEDIYVVASRSASCTIVLDRAYNELSSDAQVCCHLPENVALVESFTKFYGIPGLRLGYIVASPTLIASLNCLRVPWSVNALSIMAGEYVMSNLDSLQLNINELIGESEYLQKSIESIDGFRVERSNCNFFLVEITGGGNAKMLYNYLVENHGLLVRDCSNFNALGDNYIRIAAQSRASNQKLIAALKQWR